MEVLLLVSLLVGVAWGTVYFRRTGLWGLLVAMLLAGTVFGYPFFHVSVVTSDRLLLGLSLVVYFIYRYLGLHEPKTWQRSDTLVVLFGLVMIATTMLGDWKINGADPLSKLLFFFLLPLAVYWCVREIELKPDQIRWFFFAFAALGLYLSVTAVAEKLEIRGAIFPRYISSQKYVEFFGRGRGPLLNPSGNGILLILGMSSALMFWPNYKKNGKLLIAALIPIYLAGIYCTMTRCVWMGGIGALAVILFATMPTRFRWAFALTGFIAFAGILVLKSESFVSFKRDKNVSQADMKQSAQLRPILAVFAWKMFLDRPLLGCGTGNYLEHVDDYLAEREGELQMGKAKKYVQHNIFLALLVENGLVGLLPFAALMIQWIVWAVRLWRNTSVCLEYRQFGLMFLGFITGYLFNGLFQDVLIIPMISLYLFFLAGCLRNLVEKQAVTRINAQSERASNTWRITLSSGTPALDNGFSRRATDLLQGQPFSSSRT